MGVSMIYQAIPEQNTLFEYLLSDRKKGTLFTMLFPYGRGIFDFETIDEDERDEILDGIYGEEPFSSRTEVDQVLDELSIELERLKTLYPNLVNRNAYLEKSQTMIEEKILQELNRKNINDADDIIKNLLYGNVPLMPEFFDRYDEQLYLVPYSIAKAGAQILREIEPRNLFAGEDNPERYYREDFEQWKTFYLQASDNQEAVLVYAA
jgi:hypothetical protein